MFNLHDFQSELFTLPIRFGYDSTQKIYTIGRGQPMAILSHNGSNLKSMEKEWKQVVQTLDHERIRKEENISWESTYWGTVKHALRVTLKDIGPKQKVMLSYLMEAECTVNSLLLNYVSSDSDSLRPNHFLISSSGIAKTHNFFEKNQKKRGRSGGFPKKLGENFRNRWMR